MILYVMDEENQTFEKEVEEENHQAPDHACPNGPVLPAVLTAAAESLIFNWMIGGFWIAVSDWIPNSLVDELIVVSSAIPSVVRSIFVGRGFGGLARSTSDFLVGWRSVLQSSSLTSSSMGHLASMGRVLLSGRGEMAGVWNEQLHEVEWGQGDIDLNWLRIRNCGVGNVDGVGRKQWIVDVRFNSSSVDVFSSDVLVSFGTSIHVRHP